MEGPFEEKGWVVEEGLVGAEEHWSAVVDDLFDAEEYQTAEEDNKRRLLRVDWSVQTKSTQSAEDV